MHAAARRRGYPADLSDLATGAAGAITFTPLSHRRRVDRGWRLTPSPVQPATKTSQKGVLVPLLHTWPGAASGITSTFTPSSPCRRADRDSRLTPGQVRAGDPDIQGALLTHRAAGPGRTQCHSTRCRLCRCAASYPSSLLSLTGPRGRAADK